MYKFLYKMIVQVHFNGDFMRNNHLPASGFKPMTF